MKGGARLNNNTNRAKHISPIFSNLKTNATTLKSKNNKNNPSLIRFGFPSLSLTDNSFEFADDSLKQKNDSQFGLSRFGYSQTQQLNDFINLVKSKEDMLNIVVLKVFYIKLFIKIKYLRIIFYFRLFKHIILQLLLRFP